MSKPVVAVVVCTLLAWSLAATWIPSREGHWIESDLPLRETADAMARANNRGLPPDERVEFVEPFSDYQFRLFSGGFLPFDPWPSYDWLWAPRPTIPYHTEMIPVGVRGFTGDRIYWPALLGTQALILLLGGALLTVVVRRERRRKAAA